MPETRVCIIGMGRMGWAIMRQFARIDRENRIRLFGYDPVKIPEDDLQGRITWLPRKWSPEDVIRRADPTLIVHAAPFSTQPLYIEYALKYHKDIITLGQMTDFVLGLLQEKDTFGHGARIIPDCGLAPGLLNILAADIAFKSAPETIRIECGGLPLDPAKGGPLHYGLSFSAHGLIQEYIAPAFLKVEGEIRSVPPLGGESAHEFPRAEDFLFRDPAICERIRRFSAPPFITRENDAIRVSDLETTFTADGTSVMPWDAKFDSTRHITYRTLRYRGHYEWFRRALELKILDRHDFVTILEKLPSAVPDVVLFRVYGETRDTRHAPIQGWDGAAFADPILDAFPGLEESPVPIFSAMQHLTGWPTVFAALCLLDLWPEGRRADLRLFHGHSLEETLDRGGVILPYELLRGRALLKELAAMIPHFEVHSRGFDPPNPESPGTANP